MDIQRCLKRATGIAAVLLLLIGCSPPAVVPAPILPTAGTASSSIPPTASATVSPTSTPVIVPAGEARADGLSDEQVATLRSLEQVDKYPLYTMNYYGPYEQRVALTEGGRRLAGAELSYLRLPAPPLGWACSLFAALGDADKPLYGRNFDWQYSPAVLLFTDPPDGHASVSMVDIAYLGFGAAKAEELTDSPLVERRRLLNAPFLPFDGMNERGLAVGMAAVPPGQMRPDPHKETIGSLMVIRRILDHASTVDEAVAILQSYNIDMRGGPPIHYLIAAASGRSVLVEFHEGQIVVIPSDRPWHVATNFLRASVGAYASGKCWRYDAISQRLGEAEGRITTQDAMNLLSAVSQPSTQWSVVYAMNAGAVNVTMGRQYDCPHTFHLSVVGE